MAKYFPSPNTWLKHWKIQICISFFGCSSVYYDFDPIEGANIESEAGKDRSANYDSMEIKKRGVHYCFAPGATYSPFFRAASATTRLLDELSKSDRSLSLPDSARSSTRVYVCHGEGRSALRRWESADHPPTVKDYYYSHYCNCRSHSNCKRSGSFGQCCALTNIWIDCLPELPASASILMLVSPKSVTFAPDGPRPSTSSLS